MRFFYKDGKKTFKLSPPGIQVNVTEASEECWKNGGNLASVLSPLEWTTLHDVLNNKTGHYFVAVRGPAGYPEKMRWLNGSGPIVDKSFWHPKDIATIWEECARFWIFDPKIPAPWLYTTPCFNRNGFVCEFIEYL
ncbi:uncharacterized protein LOC141905483 [Tubulanus polymorphus]|uniref:uncharacterized protein LOC141905483 n=1 Tax=Tubulanus polymorphus TaxID=672921 RepID=UPI003DA219C0